MPIYEYQCKECGERREIIQRFSDAPLTHCPDTFDLLLLNCRIDSQRWHG